MSQAARRDSHKTYRSAYHAWVPRQTLEEREREREKERKREREGERRNQRAKRKEVEKVATKERGRKIRGGVGQKRGVRSKAGCWTHSAFSTPSATLHRFMDLPVSQSPAFPSTDPVPQPIAVALAGLLLLTGAPGSPENPF